MHLYERRRILDISDTNATCKDYEFWELIMINLKLIPNEVLKLQYRAQ